MLFNGKFAFCQFPMLFNGNLRLEKLGGMYRRMDGPSYGQTYGNSPLCPTGHRLFGAAAQKGRLRGLFARTTIKELFSSAESQNESLRVTRNLRKKWEIPL